MVNTIISRPPNAPKARTVFVDSNTAGALLDIKRLLGSSSQLALVVSGTNSNLSLSGTALRAANVLGNGNSQTAIVRETLGQVAVEYPVTLTGETGLNPSAPVLPTVQFKYATVSKLEGNSGVDNLVITMVRSITTGTLSVTTPFSAGSSSPNDFGGNAYPGAQTFVFADGASETSVNIPIQGDTDVESNDTFSLMIPANAAYQVGVNSTVTGVILNDEYPAGTTTLSARVAPLPGQTFEGSAPEGTGSTYFQTDRRNQRLSGQIIGNHAGVYYFNWDDVSQSGFRLAQLDSNHVRLELFTNGSSTTIPSLAYNFTGETATSTSQNPVYFNIETFYVPATEGQDEYTKVRIKFHQFDSGELKFNPTNLYGTKARVASDYNNYFGAIKIEGLSSVPDLLIFDPTVNPKTGELTAEIDYYLDVSGPLSMTVTSQTGVVVVPAEDVEVISNPTPGTARIRLRTNIPMAHAKSVVSVRTRSATQAIITDTSKVIFPAQLMLGQNVAGLGSPYRPQRTYTNMFNQGYWQQGESPFQTYSPGDGRGGCDDNGNPLINKLDWWYPLPEELTEVTMVFECDGGDNMVMGQGIIDDTYGVVSQGWPEKVAPGRWEYKLKADRRIAKGATCGKLQFVSIDPNSRPTNLRLYVKGEDISQRFLPSFIDFIKQLPDGYLRFMDDMGVNGELYHFGRPWVWANRPKQGNRPMNGVPIEDIIEICHRTNRGLLYNIHSSYAYEEGGFDYYGRELDLIYGVTQGAYSTPGYNPVGGVKAVITEMDNEIWNFGGFGYVGSYQYLVRVGSTGRVPGVPAYDENNGSVAAGGLVKMRNITHKTLMDFLQKRIADWRARTIQAIGFQMGESDRGNLMGDATWTGMEAYCDMHLFAPYVPNDPNAGGRAAAFSDKSPAGVSAYLAKSVKYEIGPVIYAQALRSYELGYLHGIYEVNVSIPSLGLSLAENFALQKSQEYYDVWMNSIIPMMAKCGGPIHLYSDVSGIYDGSAQQWGMHHITNTEFNKSWEAVADWSAANRVG